MCQPEFWLSETLRALQLCRKVAQHPVGLAQVSLRNRSAAAAGGARGARQACGGPAPCEPRSCGPRQSAPALCAPAAGSGPALGTL